MAERARVPRMSRAVAGILIGSMTVLAACSLAACSGHRAASVSHAPAPGNRSRAPIERASGGVHPLQEYTAAQILRKVKAAMASVTSIRVSGRVSGVVFDSFLKPPCEFAGTFHRGPVAIRVIRLGNTVYLQADAAFVRRLGMPARLAGRWVQTRADNGVVAGVAPRQLTGCFRDFSKFWAGLPTQGARKAGERTVRGQPAIELLDPQNDAAYVAATGQPYLLAFAFQGGDYVNFSSFNAPVTIAAPAKPAGTL